MSPEILEKISHPELEIFIVNIISVRKWGKEKTDRNTRNLKLFWTCKKNPRMSHETLKKTAHLDLEISKDNLISVRKWDNEQTDRHTRNLELFGTSVRTSQGCLQNISERYLIQNQSYKWTKLMETDGQMNDKRTERLIELTPQGGQLKSWWLRLVVKVYR